VLAIALFGFVNASCKAISRQYSTSQTILSKETVLIVEFELSCSGASSEKDVWYAIMNGKILPVVYHPDTKKYQVSYSDGHFTIPKGTYTFQFFNEAAIGEIRKALRNGEQITSNAAFTIDLHHSVCLPVLL
jgi:hypothetical protein